MFIPLREGRKHALETLYSGTLSKFVLKCELQRDFKDCR